MSPVPAVVIVTHDTAEELLGCLEALGVDVAPARSDGGDGASDPTGAGTAAPDEPAQIVVADAGSRDGTAELVRRIAAADPRVRLLPLANAGFGRCANAGIRATSTSTVVLINADVRLGPVALAELGRDLARHPRAGAIGPLVRYPSGRVQASARRVPDAPTALMHAVLGRIRPENAATRRYHDRVDERAGSGVRAVGWLSGCALALRREAFEQVGGFDPGYFLYVEDLDLAMRLRDAGWEILQDPCVEVVHRVGASTDAVRRRALWWHAEGLERYLLGRITPTWRLAAKAPVRVAVLGWVLVTWLSERRPSRDRSSTGERR